MKEIFVCVLALAMGGCASTHVGMGIPVPGPIKPNVGVTVDKSGVKGTGGVGGTVGNVPVHVGGTTESFRPTKDASSTKSQKKK